MNGRTVHEVLYLSSSLVVVASPSRVVVSLKFNIEEPAIRLYTRLQGSAWINSHHGVICPRIARSSSNLMRLRFFICDK